MKTPVATKSDRRRTLRNIRYAEAAMLPPGWDKGLEHQFGKALLDPTAASPSDAPCPPGLCNLHNPACAGHCRYREAELVLASTRQHTTPMPKPTTRRDRLAALGRWLAIATVCAGFALTWITHP